MAELLKLLASEAADLQVISAAVQDSLMHVGDIQFDPKARRFVASLSRFRWEQAGALGPYERVRAALSFESVLQVKSKNLRRDAPDAIADILAIEFDGDAEPPSGTARIVLAGGGEIALGVECLDVTLADIGPVWPTSRRPDHERAES
ncbi:MAG: DUF2948 family protein [Caulobacterales bacterium]